VTALPKMRQTFVIGFATEARRAQAQGKAEQQPNNSLVKQVTLIEFTH